MSEHAINIPYLLNADALMALTADNTNLVIVEVGEYRAYQSQHIRGAVFCDYQWLVSGQSPAPGLPSATETLEQLFSHLGIDDTQHVVAYDQGMGAQAARLLWTLEYLGHTRVSWLHGGLMAWTEHGYNISETETKNEARDFKAQINPQLALSTTDILDTLDSNDYVIVDARSLAEYVGDKSASRRAGHIPGARHFDWLYAIDPDRPPYLLPTEAILQRLTEAGIAKHQQLVVHCQTHQRSSHLFVVLRSLGFKHVAAYPGSWSQWGNRTDTPIQQGT